MAQICAGLIYNWDFHERVIYGFAITQITHKTARSRIIPV